MLSNIGNGFFLGFRNSLLVTILITAIVTFLNYWLAVGPAVATLYILGFLSLYELRLKKVQLIFAIVASLLGIAVCILRSDWSLDTALVVNQSVVLITIWLIFFLVVNSYNDQADVELDLKNQRTQYTSMTSSVQDYAIFLINKEGFIETWNKGSYQLTGFSMGEVIGKTPDIFHTNENKEHGLPQKLMQQAVKHNSSQFEGFVLKKGGEQFWSEITITSSKDAKGNIIGFSCVMHDRTRSKLNEQVLLKDREQIEAKNKELEQFAYITSHDLQEPLRTIQSYLEFLDSNYTDKFDDRGKKCMEFVMASSAKMSALLKGLLDYSIIGDSQEKVEVDGTMLISTIKETLFVKISESKAELSYSQLPVFKAYKPELEALVTHLIDNAIKFKHPERNPVINIQAFLKDREVEFIIEDNGIGMDMEFSEKAFLIFQQLHNRNEYPGAGIGLAHCKKIIEMHEGDIWFESELGHGTKFHFTLPI